ncbi:DUF2784 domain-containing protein [Thiomicrorhabdus sp. ZW0627]|uniref:DUF2784 domain-containing protein n=1 Tax=Thiomicrorhabdus sp. ZW0627 TaxID=3039774 RepID=UPI0024365AA9|nr:DUF2784 domain-containing protein [Thiomicrorhabdus sp. ZW0627]MDG6773253.1 DUF2784 domain-containing protein [Thiomicrorhabdus sp. ZW0627]
MLYQLAADFIVLLHFVFILFVLFGGFLVFRWPWMFWLQVPAAVWGALISLIGWTCPLTPMENSFRQAAGSSEVYSGGFIDRYLVTLVYPDGATREMAVAMGIAVIAINVAVYIWFGVRRKRQTNPLSKVRTD